MKKINFILLLSFKILLLFSCKENTFEELIFRTTEDPFYDTPKEDSLLVENTIYISWKKDEAADTFFLMRSLDQNPLYFSCVYEGCETNYADTNLTELKRYIYRLDKKRGKEYFTGENYAYAVSSSCRKDFYEPNDTEQQATFLEYDCICNLTCEKYITSSKTKIDVDWFYVSVPPRRIAEIVLSQKNGLKDNSTNALTNLKIQIPGSESEAVKQNMSIQIKNPSYVTKNICFKIMPEETGLFSENSYFTVIEYTISLNQIINYSS